MAVGAQQVFAASPATVVMVLAAVTVPTPLLTVAVSSRTTLLPESAMNRSPSASTARPDGTFRPAWLAGLPSPLYTPPFRIAGNGGDDAVGDTLRTTLLPCRR